MVALINKDIRTLRKSLIFITIISLGIIGYGIYENQVFMIPLLCAMIPLILTGINAGYDSQSKFEQMAFSMPVKKRDYVLSKLFLATAFGLLGAVSIFILLGIHGQISLENRLLVSALTLVISILFSAIQLPFVLKYGAEKGRLIFVITYLLAFGASSLFKGKLSRALEILQAQSFLVIGVGVVLIGLALIVLSTKISIGIMEKKEY